MAGEGGGFDWGSAIGAGIGAWGQYQANKDRLDAQNDQWDRAASQSNAQQGQRGWEAFDPVMLGLGGEIMPAYGAAIDQWQQMMARGGPNGGGGGPRPKGASSGMRDIANAASDYASNFTNGPLWTAGQSAITNRLNGGSTNPYMDATFNQAQSMAGRAGSDGTNLAGANPYIDRGFNFYEQFAQSRDNPGGLQDFINRQKGETQNGLGVTPSQGGNSLGYRGGSSGSGGGNRGNSQGSSISVPLAQAATQNNARRGGPGPRPTGPGGPGGPRGPMPPSPDGYAQTGPTGAAGMIREQYGRDLGSFIDESNPYLSNVLSDVANDLQSQHARNLAATDASAEGAGRYGSSAFNLERAAQAADVLRQQSQASNQLRYQDYNNQLSRFDTNRQNAMGLGTQMDMNQLDNDTQRANAALAAQTSRANAAATAAAQRYGVDMNHDMGLRGLELQALMGQQQGSLAGAAGMQGLAGLYGDLQQAGAGYDNQLAQAGLGAMGNLSSLFSQDQNFALGALPGMAGLPMDMFGGAFGMQQGVAGMDNQAASAAASANNNAWRNQMGAAGMPLDWLQQAMGIGRTGAGHITSPSGMNPQWSGVPTPQGSP